MTKHLGRNNKWRRKKTSWLVISLLFTSVLSGIMGSSSFNMTSLNAASSHHIQIESQPTFFSPNQLTILMGAPLTWENRTGEPHTVVADDCRSRTTCAFDSGFLRPNARYSLPRLKPGRYPYHCGIHPFMRGLLTIHPPRSFSSSDI